MADIPCDSKPHGLTSTKTESCTGLFRAANWKCAVAAAQLAAQNDLVAKVNAATCADDCLKSVGATKLGKANGGCQRLWFTLWIAVRCTATVTADTTITCSPQS